MRAASRPAAPGRDRHHKSRGQSFVEFALVAPVLLLLLLITLDFGRMFMSYVTLNNAARVAANFGSVNPANFTGTPNVATYNAIVNRETASLGCPIVADAGGNNPPIPTYPTGTSLGDESVVGMTCRFSPLTPLVGAIVGAPFPISVEARFPVRTGAIANIGGSSTLPPPGSPFAAFTVTGVTGGTVDGSGNVTGTAPVTVSVLDGSVNAQTYDWNWGDGSTHDYTAAPLPHLYTGTSTYTLSLTVGNSQGSTTTSVTVNLGNTPTPTPSTAPVPVLGFYGDPVGIDPQVGGGGPAGALITGSVPSTTVNFTNLTTDGTAYSWDFGDGSPAATQTNTSHAYTTKGTFTVTLTVTDPTGTAPLPKTSYVTIGCVVPTFAETSTSAAQATWDQAGFTGSIKYQPTVGNHPGSPFNPPSPSRTIDNQVGLTGGGWVPPTATGQNPSCKSDITLVYRP